MSIARIKGVVTVMLNQKLYIASQKDKDIYGLTNTQVMQSSCTPCSCWHYIQLPCHIPPCHTIPWIRYVYSTPCCLWLLLQQPSLCCFLLFIYWLSVGCLCVYTFCLPASILFGGYHLFCFFPLPLFLLFLFFQGLFLLASSFSCIISQPFHWSILQLH